MNRRAFLGAVGGASATLALGACGSTRPGARAAAGVARAASATTTRYRSRPDLRPPAIHVATKPSRPGRDAFVFTDAHAGHGQQGPMIIDRSGELVWFVPVSGGGTTRLRAMNLRVQSYRGRPVLSWWQGEIVAAHGAGHYEIVDDRYRRVAQVHAGRGLRGDLHEFRLTSRGTALLTAYEQARGQIPAPSGSGTREGAYWRCVAQEVDVASGRVLLDWRSDEHIPFSASHRLPTPADPAEPWDWFHINSINVDPEDGNLIISSRNTWSFYKVERSSGRLMWTLGASSGDFALDARARFAFQHDVVPHGGGRFTIFDNEAGPPAEASQSRGLLIALDTSRRRARFVREFRHRPAVLSPALGSVQELSDGRTFVGWGDAAWFTEYGARGEAVLDARLQGGVVSYRAFQSAWRGHPTDLPAIEARRASGGTRIAASWNGSTVHSRWRVLGGSGRTGLTRIAEVPRRGFETEIALPRTPAWVAVEALDDSGASLARSPARKV